MPETRRTQDAAPSNAALDNFRPTDALESLHAAILRVDTIVHVASEAVDRLQGTATPAARRAFARMQILIGNAAEEASAALAHGDKLMVALASYLQARRDKRETATP